MIRIYGGTVTEGDTDGVEVGTEENPILFNGLYPALTGEAIKTLKLAVRTDGESVYDVGLVVAMLDREYQDIDKNGEIYVFPYTGSYVVGGMYKPNKIIALNPQTLFFREINGANQLFEIKAKAKGTEESNGLPDTRGGLYIIPASSILTAI